MEFILKNRKKENFTIISNTFLNDPNLSLGAVALGSKLLSKPSDWVIKPPALCKELKLGREKMARLIKELEENSYLYKSSNNTIFAKKGEQKIFYYISDCKESIEEKKSEDIAEQLNSQLPFSNNIPTTENGDTLFPTTENPLHTNKEFNKNINKQKKTKLTLHKAMDEVLDSNTKNNLLQKAPDITLEEFVSLYKKMQSEFDAGFCSNLNAGLILAASGRWNFRAKTKSTQAEKDRRVLKSRVEYYADYFKVGSCKPEEILLKFEQESIKCDPVLIKEFSERLKKELGI
ncbi:hypothetical protein [uncultured Cetobacterium sp.]|uniref:hypothetical protein n=1 Tax=uncultured Cetobacterium sp. TaxID=527638 RepID=UPI0025D961F7|nr:hypothetical protein [uncultured Cetobacterium sp.]